MVKITVSDKQRWHEVKEFCNEANELLALLCEKVVLVDDGFPTVEELKQGLRLMDRHLNCLTVLVEPEIVGHFIEGGLEVEEVPGKELE